MDAKILVGVTKGGLLVPVNLWKYRGGWCGVVLWRFFDNSLVLVAAVAGTPCGRINLKI